MTEKRGESVCKHGDTNPMTCKFCRGAPWPEPLSVNVGQWSSRDYFITAASWKSEFGLDPSYEIGIRRKVDGKFWLLQSDWNHQTVQEVANSIAHLLNIETENYSPEWCQEHFK